MHTYLIRICVHKLSKNTYKYILKVYTYLAGSLSMYKTKLSIKCFYFITILKFSKSKGPLTYIFCGQRFRYPLCKCLTYYKYRSAKYLKFYPLDVRSKLSLTSSRHIFGKARTSKRTNTYIKR